MRCDVLAACDTSSKLSLADAFDSAKNKLGAITMATLFKSILLASDSDTISQNCNTR